MILSQARRRTARKFVGSIVAVVLLAVVAVAIPGFDREASAQVAPAPVEFSLDHGFYSSAQTVTLSTPTAGATIIYTLDGSEPSAANGSAYSSPLTVSSTTALRAVAMSGAGPTGEVTFYANSNFGGTSWSPGVGTYAFAAVRDSPIGNDAISSIEIPAGFEVRSCQHSNGGGICTTYTTSQATLGNLDNQISHVEITGGAAPAGPASAITTATYLFLDDVITQNGAAPGFPTGSVNGQVYNYGMDPNIVNGNEAAVIDALSTIPSVSIVADPEDLFDSGTGIYSNAQNDGREWERPASLELVDPSGAEAGFSIDAGLRIRGGFSRSDSNPKHAFRLFFRSEYGGDLDYPLFGADGASSFDRIDFRTAQNYSWSFQNGTVNDRNTFLREVFSRDTLADLGNASTRSEYYHLYLNGQYWGLFMSQERLSEEYAETYFGGDKDDYDVLKHERDDDYSYNATDGDDVAWRALWPIIEDQQVTAAEYGQLAELVDFDSLIDVNLIYAYTAEIDGAPSWFLRDANGIRNARANNWYAIRNRFGVGEAGKWTFFVHDAEHSLGGREQDPQQDRTGPWPVEGANTDYSIDYLNPGWIHQALLSNADYVAAYEARANQIFRGNGALTPAASQARWDEREAVVAQVILAESARWGDSKVEPARTTNDWSNAVAWVENNWFPSRTATVISQLGLPATLANDPPTISNPGNQSSVAGVDVSVTLNGSDPEGGDLTWEAAGLPIGLSIDADTGEISGYALEAGTFSVTATATDPLGLSATRIFTWTTTFVTPSPVILNEWNAVGSSDFLKNGGSDTFFGTVAGNGGDWFELVVTEDNVDLRGWSLEILDADNDLLTLETTDEFVFNQAPVLANVRAGTIITISEDVADDVSYDPQGGDWTLNFQANSDDQGGFFTSGSQSNFNTNNDDWQLIIRDASGAPVFGPAGEGAGASGVGSTEIGELEADPTSTVSQLSLYDDGDDSTFGSANFFDGRLQDLDAIRPTFPTVDTVEPESFVDIPTLNEVLSNGTTDLMGTATDNVGVSAVQLAVRDVDTQLWLRVDGTFGAKQFSDAVLSSPGAAETDWTFPIDLPDGNWAIQVRADDTAGNRETTRPWVNFSILTGDGVVDTEEPDTTIDTITSAAGTTTVVGTAVDNVAVDRVRVALQNTATGDWLRADGTLGAFQLLTAAVDASGATSTGWSFTTPLPDGDYAVVVRAFDRAGNEESTRPRETFSTDPAGPDTEEPDTMVDSPDVREVLTDGAVTVTGTATDNVGVAAVQVAVRDVDGQQWLRADGTFGAKQFIDGVVATPGAASTDWTYDIDLPDGNWAIQVRARDNAGNNETVRPWVNFSIDTGGGTVDVEEGDATIDSVTSTGGTTTVTGSATDNVGVTLVRIALQDTTTGDWLRADGTFGAFALLPATVDSAGATSTGWTFTAALGAGDYAVIARTVDAAGNQETTRPRETFTVS